LTGNQTLVPRSYRQEVTTPPQKQVARNEATHTNPILYSQSTANHWVLPLDLDLAFSHVKVAESTVYSHHIFLSAQQRYLNLQLRPADNVI
jgi:hypothetical protein